MARNPPDSSHCAPPTNAAVATVRFTSVTTEPRGLHLMLSPFHEQVTGAYLADLAWAVEAAPAAKPADARYA